MKKVWIYGGIALLGVFGAYIFNNSKKSTSFPPKDSAVKPELAKELAPTNSEIQTNINILPQDRKAELPLEPLNEEAIAEVFDEKDSNIPKVKIVPSKNAPAPDQGTMRPVDKETLKKAQEEFALLKTPEAKEKYLEQCMNNNRFPILRAFCFKEMTLLDSKLSNKWEKKLTPQDLYLLEFIK